MLSREDNDTMTRVGRGTPAGDLLRRYWQPVAVATELNEKSTKAVRILGEDLVLYRDKSGHYGLVGKHCPHRRAGLLYGRVEEDGIRCAYHGWKFNGAGKCLETPAEPRESTLKDRIKQTAYPVEKLGGLLFAYLGPLPAPLLPRWDVLAWEHGRRTINIQSVLACNWLQCMENSVDPSHLYWLHGASAHLAPAVGEYGEKHDFTLFEHGIMKRRTTPPRKPGASAEIDQHPLLFPNTLRHVSKDKKTGNIRHNLQFRVPMDDEHTQVYVVFFEPTVAERSPADGDVPFEPFPLRDETGAYRLDQVLVQDAMAWETQGAILDRSEEHLGSADRGVALYRKLIRDQIEVVRQGGDPVGTVRDPAKNRLIEFAVINERIGLVTPDRQAVA
jgi:5,5'-dehydrodivanillate O-demethylase